MIPKIIHQIWLDIGKGGPTSEVNAMIQGVAELCQGEWRHMLWNEESARFFIEKHYPKYLDLWDNYPYGIQRCDSLRYFILHYWGGLYIDADCIVSRLPDDDLLGNPLLAVQNIKHKLPSLNICFIGVPQGSHYMLSLIENLPISFKEKSEKKCYKNWIHRFVLQTTGPYYYTRILRKFRDQNVCVPPPHQNEIDKLYTHHFHFSWEIN